MALKPFPFSCFAYFFFKIRCAESDSTTIAPASIAVSFITNRPAPDNNGKPNSPLPRLGTQTSGVVTKKDNVPNVMIIANPAHQTDLRRENAEESQDTDRHDQDSQATREAIRVIL